MLLVMLTTLLGHDRQHFFLERHPAAHQGVLHLASPAHQTGMLGVFLALDFFLFYVFWEVMLVPMYCLIARLGKRAPPLRRHQILPVQPLPAPSSSLLAILALYFNYARTLPQGVVGTFDIPTLLAAAQQFPDGLKIWLFWGFFFALRHQSPHVPVSHLAA